MRDRLRGRRSLMPLGGLLLLSGCAGAEVKGAVTARDMRPAAPVAVEVAVSLPATQGGSQARIERNVAALEAGLTKRLMKAHIPAYVADATQVPKPGDRQLTLVVDIGRLKAGNAWSRELVGFGAGKSHLDSHVTLYDSRGDRVASVLDFHVNADSGAMPGVVVSVWNPIGLGIHGARAISKEALSDGHEDADRTAKAIVRKMVAYYQSNGWLPGEGGKQAG